mgnify:CR=1 FL=1
MTKKGYLLLVCASVICALVASIWVIRQQGQVLRVGMVLDTGGDQDRGYNEYSLHGARSAAHTLGLEFEYVISASKDEYEQNIETMIRNGADLIFTVGYTLADATAAAARRYPDKQFAIIDYAFTPGRGCAGNVADCYTEAGGLSNVTSIVFSEDQPAYLAGVLAACVSDTGELGIVAGEKIPPVVRLVEGFEKGARSINPGIITRKRYIPDFNDPVTGYGVGMSFISKGADVLFCPAGATGIGGLRSAKSAHVKAIGVDVDQYLTFPEAGSVLITSVMKNVDVAAGVIVQKFAAGKLTSGINSFDLKSGAVGLAPFHEWEDKIPQACKDLVAQANKKLVLHPEILKGETEY